MEGRGLSCEQHLIIVGDDTKKMKHIFAKFIELLVKNVLRAFKCNFDSTTQCRVSLALMGLPTLTILQEAK